ncbi:MAG: TIR domain-containing protein, partial [Gammaproteobacteria bacterium]
MPPSVFLCHSSQDKDFARELHRRLTRDGVDCFFDEASIEWGDNWVLSLEDGLQRCTYLLLVLSPHFLTSKWTQRERSAIMAIDAERIRPLLRIECRGYPEFPAFLKTTQHIDVTSDDRFEAQYPTICRLLGGTPGADPATPTDRCVLPPIQRLPAVAYMPHRSLGEHFIGRVADLWQLHDSLSEQGAAVVQGVGVVSGTGGLGKTQLAIEYAHRFGAFYPGGVFWIEAELGRAHLISRIAATANIEYDPKAPEAEQLHTVWRCLDQRAASLVLLDNFPEDEPLRPWLPPTIRTRVLVTTRRNDLTQHARIQLQVLSPEEGLRALNAGERRYGDEAKALVEAVGGLPLALELLRDALEQRTSVSVTDVLDALSSTETVALLEDFSQDYRDELPSGHERSILNTFA